MDTDIAILSDGTSLAPNGEHAMLRPEIVKPLAERIHGMNPSRWGAGSRVGTCNDCVVTLVRLTVRDQDGTVRTHTAYWDATTRASVPEAVIQIHDIALGAR